MRRHFERIQRCYFEHILYFLKIIAKKMPRIWKQDLQTKCLRNAFFVCKKATKSPIR